MNEEMPVLSLAHPCFGTDLLVRRESGSYVFVLSGEVFHHLDDEVRGLIALLDATDELVRIEGVGERRRYTRPKFVGYNLRPAYLARNPVYRAKKQEEPR